MRILLFSFIFMSTLTAEAATNPVKLPVWSDMDKYQSKATIDIPSHNVEWAAMAGLHMGFKNGFGLDTTFSKKLSRYLFGGLRIFIGSLQSDALVRSPSPLETAPYSGEYATIITSPAESWFAFVPEVGLTVHTQIIPIADLYHETAWFGIGKAMIGGRSGWAFSFEPGINKKFKADENWGMTLRAKYTFGWLKNLDGSPGTIPYDWFNLTGGIYYMW